MTLAMVAANAGPYPTDVLDGCKTGLCLFSAAFLGANDAALMVSAGLTIDAVDTNQDRLAEMQGLYPDHCVFHHMDAWMFALYAQEALKKWDVVSVDPFTGDTEDRVLADLELWCSLAEKAVTVTIRRGGELPAPPAGWELAEVLPRSGNASWMVLERA